MSPKDLSAFKKKYHSSLDAYTRELIAVFEEHLRTVHDTASCRKCFLATRRLNEFAAATDLAASRPPDHQARIDAAHAAAVEEDLKDPNYAARARAEHEAAVAADQAAYEARMKQHAEESAQHAEFYKTGKLTAPPAKPSKKR